MRPRSLSPSPSHLMLARLSGADLGLETETGGRAGSVSSPLTRKMIFSWGVICPSRYASNRFCHPSRQTDTGKRAKRPISSNERSIYLARLLAPIVCSNAGRHTFYRDMSKSRRRGCVIPHCNFLTRFHATYHSTFLTYL